MAQGAVLVDDAGRIAAVGPEVDLPAPSGIPTVALGRAALLPGMINTHTHLELTGLGGSITADDFPGWISQLIALKAARSPAEVSAAARQGVADCWAQGITTVADTGDSGAVIEALAELGGSGIAYHEIFGPDPTSAVPQFAGWKVRLEELRQFTGARIRLGASPHAPFSVSGPLYALVAAYATEQGLPLAVHLAESEDESLLLEQSAGGFARMWEGRGIARPEHPGRSPVAWLDAHGVLGAETLCIHVVRADAADLDCLAERRVAIAHCPRSNAAHGHGAAPLRAMLERGLRVGVGTDSVASVAPLDLLAEVRAARALGGLSAQEALDLVTRGAARALGLERQIGSLVPGKWADLAAFELPSKVDAEPLLDTLLSLAPSAVRLTVVSGREVFRR